MKALVFLNGHYFAQDSALIRRIIKAEGSSSVLIAVDGGLAILQKNNIKPDYWISDLDSSPRIKKGFLKHTELLFYPSAKDKTDTELTLDLCAALHIREITLFGWYDRRSETDHLLGNLLIWANPAFFKHKFEITYIDSHQTIYPLYNGRKIIRGHKGRKLSIVPLDKQTRLTLSGVKYPLTDAVVRRGQTISLRNEITSNRAVVESDKRVLVIVS